HRSLIGGEHGGDTEFAADIAALGQVVSSHAYYLDPRLALGVFEPSQVAVNPPFEIALVHYWLALANYDSAQKEAKCGNKDKARLIATQAADDCERAWACASIGMRFLFKFNFSPGLQGLAGCRLLEMIALLYMKIATLKPDKKPKKG